MIDDNKIDEIKSLKEQNAKLEIISNFYKMSYEDGLAELKSKTDAMLKNISDAGKYEYHYQYPKADITADAVVFAFDRKDRDIKILLIKRGADPFKDCWALPGGYIKIIDEKEETIDECACRELEEETKLKIDKMEQMHVFSRPDRDPRGRVITVAFTAIASMQPVEGGDDAAHAEWVSIEKVPDKMAFDHSEIVKMALEKLKYKLFNEHVAFDLLGKTFTIPDVQIVYEKILGVKYDRRNFNKRIAARPYLVPSELNAQSGTRLGTNIYEFDEEAYEKVKNDDLKLLY